MSVTTWHNPPLYESTKEGEMEFTVGKRYIVTENKAGYQAEVTDWIEVKVLEISPSRNCVKFKDLSGEHWESVNNWEIIEELGG